MTAATIASVSLMLHRVRDQLIVAAQRQAGVRQLLAVLGEVEDHRTPPLAREVLQILTTHLRELESKLAALDRQLVALTRTDPICRALDEMPGIGPVIATAFAATVPAATGSARAGTWPPGSGWCPGSTPAAARRASSA